MVNKIDGQKNGPKWITYLGLFVGSGRITDTTGRYGVEQLGTLKRRAEIVEAVRYN